MSAKFLRNAILFAAAIATVDIAFRELGILISIGQLLPELTPSEVARREAYEIVIAFCVATFAISIAVGFLIYRQIRELKSTTLAGVIAVFGLLVYGPHLAFAYVLQVSNSVLDDFIYGFAWVSEIGLVTVAVLLALTLSQSIVLGVRREHSVQDK